MFKILKKIILLICVVFMSSTYAYSMQEHHEKCDNGDYVICEEIGQLYLMGMGVEQSNEKAKEFFQKSYDISLEACEKNNNFEACHYVGNMYDSDYDIVIVPHDSNKAQEFFKKACDGGFKDSCEFVN